MTAEETEAPTSKRVNIRNRYVLVGSILAACLGLGCFVLRSNAPPGWYGLALAFSVISMWVFFIELRGVAAVSGTLSFPRRPLRWFPIVPIWRSRVLLTELDEMTLLRPWLAFQVVRLDGQFGSERLLFDSRKARLRFFDAVMEQRPHVPIYRMG
jgi:hypothetical protein